jgi:hypothetical protein
MQTFAMSVSVDDTCSCVVSRHAFVCNPEFAVSKPARESGCPESSVCDVPGLFQARSTNVT